jgi:hypothetical protein
MLLTISKFQGFEGALAERGNENVDLALSECHDSYFLRCQLLHSMNCMIMNAVTNNFCLPTVLDCYRIHNLKWLRKYNLKYVMFHF